MSDFNNHFIVKGVITATSEKGKFKKQTKCAYMSLTEEGEKACKREGIKIFRSKDGVNFVILYFFPSINLYVKGNLLSKVDCKTGAKNFKMKDIGLINIVIGNTEGGKKFFRIADINLESKDGLEYFAPKNPFEKFIESDELNF